MGVVQLHQNYLRKSSKTSSNNKFIDIANLKKNAKGDNKIIMNDRIYIWYICGKS